MPQLNIKNERAHELAGRLAKVTGKTVSAAVVEAMEEHLARIERLRNPDATEAEIDRIVSNFNRRPVLDPRSAEEITNDLYDENGLPA